MKTFEQIKEGYYSKCIDGRDLDRLAAFIPESELEAFGLELKEEAKGTWQHKEMTRDAVIAQLKEDVAFGFKKAIDERGISSSLMYAVVQMWNWILEEGLEDFDDYGSYGMPLFKATAEKYKFEIPKFA